MNGAQPAGPWPGQPGWRRRSGSCEIPSDVVTEAPGKLPQPVMRVRGGKLPLPSGPSESYCLSVFPSPCPPPSQTFSFSENQVERVHFCIHFSPRWTASFNDKRPFFLELAAPGRPQAHKALKIPPAFLTWEFFWGSICSPACLSFSVGSPPGQLVHPPAPQILPAAPVLTVTWQFYLPYLLCH